MEYLCIHPNCTSNQTISKILWHMKISDFLLSVCGCMFGMCVCMRLSYHLYYITAAAHWKLHRFSCSFSAWQTLFHFVIAGMQHTNFNSEIRTLEDLLSTMAMMQCKQCLHSSLPPSTALHFITMICTYARYICRFHDPSLTLNIYLIETGEAKCMHTFTLQRKQIEHKFHLYKIQWWILIVLCLPTCMFGAVFRHLLLNSKVQRTKLNKNITDQWCKFSAYRSFVS